MGLVGIGVMILIAYLMSSHRSRIDWRLVGAGLALQGLFGFIVLRTAAGRWFFRTVGEWVSILLGFAVEGARFVFGNMTQSTVPVGTLGPDGGIQPAGLVADTGAFFAFTVLPTIIFFSALMSVLYHVGLMQLVVRGVAWVMQRTLRTSGAETLSASGNIFVGQTEAPLLIKPFVDKMTLSELHTVMTGGFATVAGGVLAIYVLLLQDAIPQIAGHLIAASVMNAPAGILLSKIILPETGKPVTANSLEIAVEKAEANVIDAAAAGAATGWRLAINVGAMLMAFVSLLALLNALLGWAGSYVGLPELTLQSILGTLARPLAWVMGVPWESSGYVGGLIGVKVVLTELIAYTRMSADLAGGTALDPRSSVILAYALLGFANLPSIAIQIGGISGLAPERRSELAQLGLRAMIAGNLAAFMSASWAGMLV
jgi:CNT family concentrative nucleoside transporter